MQNIQTSSQQPEHCFHNIDDLIQLFESTFFNQFNTRLIIGEDEPIYLPKSEFCSFNQIIFAHGFYASALHEISHWCVAGAKRRLLEDFGYWYLPDGRNREQQAKFELAELKPQAVEWALSVACNKPFDVSVDNLNGEAEPNRVAFKAKVLEQVKCYFEQGFPPQAQDFIFTLSQFYKTKYPLSLQSFEKNEAPQLKTAKALVNA